MRRPESAQQTPTLAFDTASQLLAAPVGPAETAFNFDTSSISLSPFDAAAEHGDLEQDGSKSFLHGVARHAISVVERIGDTAAHVADVLKPSRRTVARVVAGAIAVGSSAAVAESLLIETAAGAPTSSHVAKKHRHNTMTPANILTRIKNIKVGGPGTKPTYASLTPTSLKVRANCTSKKFGYKRWEDTPTHFLIVPCSKDDHGVNVQGGGTTTAVPKYTDSVNSLGSSIRTHYGRRGIKEDTLSIAGTPKRVTVKFACPQPSDSDYVITDKYPKQMVVTRGHTKAAITNCS